MTVKNSFVLCHSRVLVVRARLEPLLVQEQVWLWAVSGIYLRGGQRSQQRVLT